MPFYLSTSLKQKAMWPISSNRKGSSFPVLMDKGASVTRKKFGVYVVPTLFITDKNDMIKDKAYGYLSEQGLWDFVNPNLKKKG